MPQLQEPPLWAVRTGLEGAHAGVRACSRKYGGAEGLGTDRPGLLWVWDHGVGWGCSEHRAPAAPSPPVIRTRELRSCEEAALICWDSGNLNPVDSYTVELTPEEMPDMSGVTE